LRRAATIIPTPFRGRKFFFMLLGILSGCMAHTEKRPGDMVINYPFARDSFLIRITDLATNAAPGDTIHFVYYVDQSLKSGKQVEQAIEKYNSALLKKNYVFVGIGHFGYFRSKRRRDFISPSVPSSNGYIGKSEEYGQADNFYQLLKETIIPQAESRFGGHTIERSFIGHSLGGLFATYLVVNGDELFTNLYALSPSLWIDDYHILDYESSQQQKLKNVKKNFWISCGGAETWNRIRTSVRKMNDSLDKRKYDGIHHNVKIYKGQTHNSAVQPELNDIFAAF
jgi:predicted alpha/beta superfamily hydrolase